MRSISLNRRNWASWLQRPRHYFPQTFAGLHQNACGWERQSSLWAGTLSAYGLTGGGRKPWLSKGFSQALVSGRGVSYLGTSFISTFTYPSLPLSLSLFHTSIYLCMHLLVNPPMHPYNLPATHLSTYTLTHAFMHASIPSPCPCLSCVYMSIHLPIYVCMHACIQTFNRLATVVEAGTIAVA